MYTCQLLLACMDSSYMVLYSGFTDEDKYYMVDSRFSWQADPVLQYLLLSFWR